MDEAKKGLPYEVKVPHHGSASESNLTSVLLRSEDSQVLLLFASGVIMRMWPNFYPDPAAVYGEKLAQGGADTSVLVVRGVPALAIEGDTDVFHSNPSWLEWVENGTTMVLRSDGDTIAELIEVADTVS